ncbi:hypothetical protein [Pedobacter deserti]|uniref:hypothetical protein n=1 Tax=Pedobacter deserti TaxID=2817382 RepID=UPI00210BEA00|nr:hypothetical protein [Pedobacter sp. SYSU D00382]
MDQNEKDRNSDKPREPQKDAETVRGSGFTYDEDKGRTDKSMPEESADEDTIVNLPDLGKKNRP